MLAATEIEQRKEVYRNNGISYLKPWLFIISDGAPTDSYESAAQNLCSQEKNGKFTTFAIGVENADLEILSKFTLKGAKKLRGIEFKQLFQWISASVRVGSQKADDQQKVSLPSVNWEEV